MDEARPEQGPPPEALARVLAAGWRELDRYGAIGAAAAAQLSPDALTQTHESAHERVRKLVERGQGDGSFPHRPAGRLAGGQLLRAHPRLRRGGPGGRIDPDRGLDVLAATVRSLVTAAESS